jgi:hypothetical protein
MTDPYDNRRRSFFELHDGVGRFRVGRYRMFGFLKGFTLAFDAIADGVSPHRLDVYRRSASLGVGLPFADVAVGKSVRGVKSSPDVGRPSKSVHWRRS